MQVKVTSGLRLDVYKSVHGSPKRISPFGMSVELVKVRISGIASYKRNYVMQLRIVMCFFLACTSASLKGQFERLDHKAILFLCF